MRGPGNFPRDPLVPPYPDVSPRDVPSNRGRYLLVMAFMDGPQAVTTATLTSTAELQKPIE